MYISLQRETTRIKLFVKKITMKNRTVCLAIATTIALLAFKPISPSTWSLDKAHAKLGFTITHLMVSDVEGNFKSFESKITGTKEDFSDAVVELTADVSSIGTDNVQRDNHLKGADFFDASNYPTLSFKSKSFTKISSDTYKVIGDLSLHGITKSIELIAIARSGTNPMSKKSITGFKVTGIIKRTDFNISSATPSAMLSNEVTINANAEYAKE
jgi:polyisoprenoid-binding protein YceI